MTCTCITARLCGRAFLRLKGSFPQSIPHHLCIDCVLDSSIAMAILQVCNQLLHYLALITAPGIQLHHNLFHEPRFNTRWCRTARYCCHTMSRKVIGTADNLSSLLREAGLQAAPGKDRIQLLVGLATRFLDYCIVQSQRTLHLPVVDARLHEASVDLQVRPESM